MTMSPPIWPSTMTYSGSERASEREKGIQKVTVIDNILQRELRQNIRIRVFNEAYQMQFTNIYQNMFRLCAYDRIL